MAKKKTAKKTAAKKTARKKRTTKASAAKKAAAPRPRASRTLRIAVTFRRPSDNLGPTAYAGRLNAAMISDFEPEPLSVDQAIHELQGRGFEVTSRGRLSVSVRGSTADFEKCFGTRLTRFTLQSDRHREYAAASFYYPADGAPWSPDPAVAALIDDAYIQWPHVYMNHRFAAPPPSPLPPRVGYHHLRVPGDVALLMSAARVHRQGVTGRGVRVAMIDSGFAHSHPYFQEMGYNTATVLAPGASHADRDGNGHGTGESANVLAIAPDATFIGVKLDNETTPQLGASVLEGFQEAVTHAPDVISVSLGFDLVRQDVGGRRHLTSLPNSLVALEAEIQAAVAAGTVVVFSAGNGHVAFPGMMPEVISAGGTFVAEDGQMQASDYASAFVSKIYPGRRVPDFCGLVGMASNNADYIMLPIESACDIDQGNSSHDGTGASDAWGVFSGTSAAAPQLAAVCALLLEEDASLTPAEVKSILRRTSRDVVSGHGNAASNEGVAMAAAAGPDGATGAGLVDAFAAWLQV